MTNDITAQAFREAALNPDDLSTGDVVRLLLAAAEQREQLDMSRAQVTSSDHAATEMLKRKNEQIATLTARIVELEGKTDPRWRLVVEHITDSNAKLDELSRRLQSLGERTEQ